MEYFGEIFNLAYVLKSAILRFGHVYYVIVTVHVGCLNHSFSNDLRRLTQTLGKGGVRFHQNDREGCPIDYQDGSDHFLFSGDRDKSCTGGDNPLVGQGLISMMVLFFLTVLCNPPCMNGGSCTDVNTCTCSTGYTGDVCETGMKSISKFIWIVVTNINNVHFVKSKKVCEEFVTFL